MGRTSPISSQAVKWILDFIEDLRTGDELNTKTLRNYASDLRHFAEWVETSRNSCGEGRAVFHPAEITTPILIRYREYMQKVLSQKPATINRRLNTLKHFFDWAMKKKVVSGNPTVKLVLEKKNRPDR